MNCKSNYIHIVFQVNHIMWVIESLVMKPYSKANLGSRNPNPTSITQTDIDGLLVKRVSTHAYNTQSCADLFAYSTKFGLPKSKPNLYIDKQTTIRQIMQSLIN
jgi:hypothetical protein